MNYTTYNTMPSVDSSAKMTLLGNPLSCLVKPLESRDACGSQFGEHFRIERIILGVPKLGLGKIVGLSKVNHAHGKACVIQDHGKRHPIAPRCLHDNQNAGRIHL